VVTHQEDGCSGFSLDVPLEASMLITVLGTGIMGAAVTRTLVRNGHDVTVWNRTPERAEPLRDDGATVATTLAEAVRRADAVVVTVFDGEAVFDVMTGGLDAAADAVWVQASTIGLAETARAAELAREHGGSMIEAMMLGTKAPAEQGKLTLLVAGDPALVERVEPIFDALSTKVIRVGPTVGQASALKLATNSWVGAVTAAAAQSLALASGLGLDPTMFLDAIDGAPVDCQYAHVKGKAMLEKSFAPSFTVDGVVKDLDLMIAAAGQAGIRDELLSTVQSMFRHASERGHADDDMAAVITAFPRA
jgi:3-hydroxyisobutyrate dehydrogenase